METVFYNKIGKINAGTNTVLSSFHCTIGGLLRIPTWICQKLSDQNVFCLHCSHFSNNFKVMTPSLIKVQTCQSFYPQPANCGKEIILIIQSSILFTQLCDTPERECHLEIWFSRLYFPKYISVPHLSMPFWFGGIKTRLGAVRRKSWLPVNSSIAQHA